MIKIVQGECIAKLAYAMLNRSLSYVKISVWQRMHNASCQTLFISFFWF